MKPNLIAAFITTFIIFVPMERVFALRRQKIFRKGWLTDFVHFFVSYFVIQIGVFVVFVLMVTLLKWAISPGFQAAVAAQSVWLQFLEALLVAELAFYAGHRMTHEIPWLWRFHAVHHSIEEMDWLASARVHPVDQIFVKSLTILPLYVMGFTEQTFGLYLIAIALQTLFVHANVRFRFGLLRWVFSTPEFHHWHHAAEPQAVNKNYAGQLPLLDLLFGTLYLPKRRMPEKYGIAEPIPSGYLGQMIHPFRRQLDDEQVALPASAPSQDGHPSGPSDASEIVAGC
jgi:sterol desaturase/sphingolipid hydroxylase (fatty acid hydroxylase superfamily)